MTPTAIPIEFPGHTISIFETDPDVTVEQSIRSPRNDRLPPGTIAVSDVEGLGRKFTDVQELIVTVCTGLHDAIAKIPKPEVVEVEFGVKLGGEGGLPMVAKASAEANFKIKIVWKIAAPSVVATPTDFQAELTSCDVS